MKQLFFQHNPHLFQAAWALTRVGIGLSFIFHGYPKLTGGLPQWEALGSQMALVGITFWAPFWGFMAAVAEFVGGLLLLAGLFTRPAAFLLLSTMIIALLSKLSGSSPYDAYAQPLKLLFVFAAFLIAGGGRYALDRLFITKKRVA